MFVKNKYIIIRAYMYMPPPPHDPIGLLLHHLTIDIKALAYWLHNYFFLIQCYNTEQLQADFVRNMRTP